MTGFPSAPATQCHLDNAQATGYRVIIVVFGFLLRLNDRLNSDRFLSSCCDGRRDDSMVENKFLYEKYGGVKITMAMKKSSGLVIL